MVRHKGRKLYRNAKHDDFCFAPLSDDGSSCWECSLLPEPNAAEDTLHLQDEGNS